MQACMRFFKISNKAVLAIVSLTSTPLTIQSALAYDYSYKDPSAPALLGCAGDLSIFAEQCLDFDIPCVRSLKQISKRTDATIVTYSESPKFSTKESTVDVITSAGATRFETPSHANNSPVIYQGSLHFSTSLWSNKNQTYMSDGSWESSPLINFRPARYHSRSDTYSYSRTRVSLKANQDAEQLDPAQIQMRRDTKILRAKRLYVNNTNSASDLLANYLDVFSRNAQVMYQELKARYSADKAYVNGLQSEIGDPEKSISSENTFYNNFNVLARDFEDDHNSRERVVMVSETLTPEQLRIKRTGSRAEVRPYIIKDGVRLSSNDHYTQDEQDALDEAKTYAREINSRNDQIYDRSPRLTMTPKTAGAYERRIRECRDRLWETQKNLSETQKRRNSTLVRQMTTAMNWFNDQASRYEDKPESPDAETRPRRRYTKRHRRYEPSYRPDDNGSYVDPNASGVPL